MTPHWSDPQEVREILNARKMARDNEWLKGYIGEATYVLSLRILGYDQIEAKMELNLLKERV